MGSSSELEVPAMAFYHEDGLVSAWKQAMRFAGKGGRIATLPDIIAARIAAEPGTVPWERYFTTASAEYMGFGRNGRRIIIVAHGVGPMATIDGILKVYSYQYKDKIRNLHGGRISTEQFRALEDGTYGDVHIIDLESFLERYEFPFLEHLTATLALFEPLVMARFGPRSGEYVERHRKVAQEYHRKNGNGEVMDPYILQMGDAANCSYIHSTGDVFNTLDNGGAFAHLLAIGGLTNMHLGTAGPKYPRYPSLTCEVGCHAWSDGVRIAGVRADATMSGIHPGFENIRNLVQRHWKELLRPVSTPSHIDFCALVKIGRQWFTQCPKVGARMDTYEPEFHVISMKKVGDVVPFTTTIGDGYHGFFRYNLREMKSIAPLGANAYVVVGDPQIIWKDGNPTLHCARVQFYRVEIDTSRRLVHRKVLCNEYDTLMRILVKESA